MTTMVSGVLTVLLVLFGGALAGCSAPAAPPGPARTESPSIRPPVPSVQPSAQAAVPPSGVPTPDHVIVVVLENHALQQVVGSSSAPYLTSLAHSGANFARSFAVAHPSEPNYLALFSGSTQGITDDSCPHTFSGANLGSELTGAGLSFAGYAESMPSDGYAGCSSGEYARKHTPWTDFTNVAASSSLVYGQHFPSNFAQLPRVSFVIPNLCDDIHDCSIATGDMWLKNNLDAYNQWAQTHNSLLVVTFDEDDTGHNNQIPTIFSGQHVKPGSYSEHIDHYSVLRTLEDAFSLPCTGNACNATPVTDVWQ